MLRTVSAGPTIVVPGRVGRSTEAPMTPGGTPSSSMASDTTPLGSPSAMKRSTTPCGGRGTVIMRMRSGAMRPVSFLSTAFTRCLPCGSIKRSFGAATLHPDRSAANAVAARAQAVYGGGNPQPPACGPSGRSLGFAAPFQGKHAMIDLYALTSPNVQKIFIALEELGLAYKLIPVDVWKGEQYKPEFLRLCPNAKIPVIVDHDGPGGKPFTVFESGAILMYLADQDRASCCPRTSPSATRRSSG